MFRFYLSVFFKLFTKSSTEYFEKIRISQSSGELFTVRKGLRLFPKAAHIRIMHMHILGSTRNAIQIHQGTHQSMKNILGEATIFRWVSRDFFLFLCWTLSRGTSNVQCTTSVLCRCFPSVSLQS